MNPGDPWEAAYVRFETPEEEIRKFIARLRMLGSEAWPRDARVVELFCGRGNGLHALSRMGFTELEGADLSVRLLKLYRGGARCYACDCRKLPFADKSRDVLIVQGGLHHLPTLPDSLEETLAEMHRVLRTDGKVVIVEPWLTAFLRVVHRACENQAMRRLWHKLDDLAIMIENERSTYEQWLSQPDLVLGLTRRYFVPIQESFAWGKWNFAGAPK
jgi:ubiquinone/menaquinone biosynthesis C-methylase UbiE